MPSPSTIPCYRPEGLSDDLASVRPATVDPRAGRAAYEFLIAAIDLALDRGGSMRSRRCR